MLGFSFARWPFWGSSAGTPAGVRAAFLGRESGGAALLYHRLPAGMPPASAQGVLPDTISRGILTAEGTHPTGEPSEERKRILPVLISKKGSMVERQLSFLS